MSILTCASSSVAANNLSVLKRKPSDLQRYIAWTNQIKAVYGAITTFVLRERLFWNTLPSVNLTSGPTFACSSSYPFASRDDYRILLNDWPYGIDPGISHLIAWSKNRLHDEEPDGYLSPESTTIVETFVKRTFVDRLVTARVADAESKVLWFRNWTGLQSVKGLEHVHVLVRDAPKYLIVEWTSR